MSNSSRQDFEEESRGANRSGTPVLPTAPLPNHIGENIEAVVTLHASAERNVPRHQRVVEAVTTFFGRPVFLYGILIVVPFWVLFNVLPQGWGLAPLDPPPFDWLEFLIGTGSLVMTVAVLIKQNRQEKLEEQRAQLGLQMNLLSEQKIAKLIALVEELRSDLPNVKDHHDSEAEAMKQAADPQIVMNALEGRLEEELVQLQKQELAEFDH